MRKNDWYKRQKKDLFKQNALKEGFVSRSAYKLIEIEKKFKLIKRSNSILELGSSPGGWSQVIIKNKNIDNFKLVCVDLLENNIELNNNIFFIQGNFNDDLVRKKIKNFHINKFNLILSDMSPNTIGHQKTDHLKIIQMADDILNFSLDYLKFNSNLVIKIFQGSNEKIFIDKLNMKFEQVKYFKPKSSRKESSEIYLICLKFKK